MIRVSTLHLVFTVSILPYLVFTVHSLTLLPAVPCQCPTQVQRLCHNNPARNGLFSGPCSNPRVFAPWKGGQPCTTLVPKTFAHRKAWFKLYLFAFCFVFDDNFFLFFTRIFFLFLLLIRKFRWATIQFHFSFQLICTSLNRVIGNVSAKASAAITAKEWVLLITFCIPRFKCFKLFMDLALTSRSSCHFQNTFQGRKRITVRIFLQRKTYNR